MRMRTRSFRSAAATTSRRRLVCAVRSDTREHLPVRQHPLQHPRLYGVTALGEYRPRVRVEGLRQLDGVEAEEGGGAGDVVPGADEGLVEPGRGDRAGGLGAGVDAVPCPLHGTTDQ